MARFSEDPLAARVAALPAPADDSDWLDVRRRARRTQRRRAAAAALAAAAVAAVAAPAFGLHRVVVEWVAADPAPEPVQLQFNQLAVGAPPGMDPQVIPDSARKVMEARLGGRVRILWVSPTRKGGFCYVWTGGVGGCAADPNRLAGGRVRRDDENTRLLGLSWMPDERGIIQEFSGHLHARETEQLAVEFADGTREPIRVVWVSPPIDAGFYAYEVRAEHRRVGRHVTAVVARDADGNVLARQVFALTPPAEVRRPVRLPDGQVGDLPAKAIVGRARKAIDFESVSGRRVTLWVIPTMDGGRCYVYNRGGGCTQPGRDLDVPMAAGLHGGPTVLFGGQVRNDVAVVELHYQDGTSERVKPVEGFVLYEIPPAHYARGRRLELAIARDPFGTELGRHPIRDSFGIYPCEKPVDVGRGVKACP